jgi:hypothetical protein
LGQWTLKGCCVMEHSTKNGNATPLPTGMPHTTVHSAVPQSLQQYDVGSPGGADFWMLTNGPYAEHTDHTLLPRCTPARWPARQLSGPVLVQHPVAEGREGWVGGGHRWVDVANAIYEIVLGNTLRPLPDNNPPLTLYFVVRMAVMSGDRKKSGLIASIVDWHRHASRISSIRRIAGPAPGCASRLSSAPMFSRMRCAWIGTTTALWGYLYDLYVVLHCEV